MCRFLCYIGSPMYVGDVVVHPQNSLICQARNAAYHPGVNDPHNTRNIVVNGDGFGLAWYDRARPSMGACVFKFTTPAWSDGNLRSIGDHVRSSLIFAHVRAASDGHDPSENVVVSYENCHPFKHERYTFMHNGAIPEFHRIKKKLVAYLSNDTYLGISGSTDSEHIFALILHYLTSQPGGLCKAAEGRPAEYCMQKLISAVEKAFAYIMFLLEQASVEYGKPLYVSLNICITDGLNTIASRFRSGPKGSKEAPPSLYYSYGDQYCKKTGCFMDAFDQETLSEEINGEPNGTDSNSSSSSSSSSSRSGGESCPDSKPMQGLIITSSPLNRSEEDDVEIDEEGELLREQDRLLSEGHNWKLLPRNTMLLCTVDTSDPTQVTEINIKPLIINTLAHPTSREGELMESPPSPKLDADEKIYPEVSEPDSLVPSREDWTSVMAVDKAQYTKRENENKLDPDVSKRWAETDVFTARRVRAGSLTPNTASTTTPLTIDVRRDDAVPERMKTTGTATSQAKRPRQHPDPYVSVAPLSSPSKSASVTHPIVIDDGIKPLLVVCTTALAAVLALQVVVLTRIK